MRLYLALYVFLDYFFVNYNRCQFVASVPRSFSKKQLFRSLPLTLLGRTRVLSDEVPLLLRSKNLSPA